MVTFMDLIGGASSIVPILRTIIFIVILFFIFSFLVSLVNRALLKRAKSKRQTSNVKIFTRILRYTFLILLIVLAIFSYTGSLTGLGVTVGLISAALGFALQKPITSVVAWIMIVFKRPFDIGDRIIVGNVKGDVKEITMTHIYLEEVGAHGGEEGSRRTVIMPNYLLFEQSIVNYSLQDEFILGEVAVTVTYEGNLDKAIKICLDSAIKYTKDFAKSIKTEPYTRLAFDPSGVVIKVRYFVPFYNAQEISSNMTKEIYESINKAKDVDFAYPHTEFVISKKKSVKFG